MQSYEAIKAVLKGHKISRSGWNGKGMFVYHLNIEGFRPVLVIRNAQGEHQPGWVFSQEDVFAEDWGVL